MSVLLGAAHGAAAVGGRALGAAMAGIGAVRPADKPLHPRGAVVPALLRRTGSDQRTGVAWLDEPGDDDVLVRRSRSAGLPPPAPDILGLSFRVPTSSGSFGDLLFATTGTGTLTRFLLRPAWSPYGRAMTTLLPYRSPAGPLLLGAIQTDARNVDLLWACGSGSWWRFGRAHLAEDPGAAADAAISFDPVRNTVPGLEVYDWVRRLREPAYAAARRSRGLPG